MPGDITAALIPVFLFAASLVVLAGGMIALAYLFNPRRPGRVKQMPYESGMDPIHDTRRRFDVRFNLVAIAFLVFDVELLFLYPWAVTVRPAQEYVPSPVAAVARHDTARDTASALEANRQSASRVLERSAGGKVLIQQRELIFGGVMVFIGLLALGFIYDWRKGIFRWR